MLGEPLNVTDLDVGPDGWLYFATGGRGTSGGLYRVTYGQPGRAFGGGGRVARGTAADAALRVGQGSHPERPDRGG